MSRKKVRQIRERCPHLDALAGHITEFAKILTGRRGAQLDAWIAAVDTDDQPDLHSFTTGLKNDYDAVLNGLTLPYSSGKVEGNVNRIKMIKRQMYGRAGFDLLRKRVTAGPLTNPGRHHHEMRARSNVLAPRARGKNIHQSWFSTANAARLGLPR